jgi:hypothetical protein
MQAAPWLSGSLKLGRTWLKVERAAHHLDELGQLIERIENAPFKIAETKDPANGDRVWVMQSTANAEHLLGVSMYGVIIGDFVHNLRSALDHTIWKLANPPSRANAFPVCISESGASDSFYGTAKEAGLGVRRLRNVPNPAFDFVADVQPYNRLQDRDPLWQLNEMWNEDKHRTLLVVANPSWSTPFVVATKDGRDVYEGETKEKDPNNPAEVFRLDANSDSEVIVGVPGKVDIRFASPPVMANRVVMPTLGWIFKYVSGVLLSGLESYL